MPVALQKLSAALRELRPGSRSDALRLPGQVHWRGRLAGALGLLTGAAVGFAWANSPWAAGYTTLRDAAFVAGFAAHPIGATLRGLVNNGLMTVFFFSLGLAVKREAFRRRWTDPTPAAAVAAALAAALPPMLLLSLSTSPAIAEHGWALALGPDLGFVALALAAARHHASAPARGFTFAFGAAAEALAVLALTAFGAAGAHPLALVAAAGLYAAYAAAVRLRAWRGTVQLGLGAAFWIAWNLAGLPPPVAGAFLALFISLRPTMEERKTAESADVLLDQFDTATDDGQADRASGLAARLARVAAAAEPPSDRWQRRLAPWIAVVVLPLFGLVNAGAAGAGWHAIAGWAAALLLTLSVGKTGVFLFLAWTLSHRACSTVPSRPRPSRCGALEPSERAGARLA